MKTATVSLIFSWLLAATTTLSGQTESPCPKTPTWAGWDLIVFSAGNATSALCVGINPDDDFRASGGLLVKQVVPAGGALSAAADTVLQNIPAGDFGFYQVTDRTVAWYRWNPSGAAATKAGNGRFASAGGYGYAPQAGGGLKFRFPSLGQRFVIGFPAPGQLAQAELPDDGSIDWWRTQCAAAIHVNGYEFCNHNGLLFEVNNDSFGSPNYQLGARVVGPSEKGEVVMDVVAGSGGTFYATTAATTADHHDGGLFAFSVDESGNVSDTLICRCAYVPGDGRVRLAAGKNGVYAATGPAVIAMFTLHGGISGYSGWVVWDNAPQTPEIGALAVLTEEVPDLP